MDIGLELECEECGAPAAVVYTYALSGVEPTGDDAVYTMQRINCAAGHWYDVMDMDSIITYEEDE